jgi:transcription antitermination factor NusG
MDSSATIQQSIGKARNWYAVFTSSRHEKAVARHLEQRQLENFLPLYACVRRRANRCRVKLELPLFPNYAFVRIADNERGRVLEIPGVLSIVGSRSMPASLPEAQIESLRAGIQQRQAEPHPYLVAGERARIIRGALAGMEGVLLRRNNGFRVVLSLEQIMQSVAVEVDAFDIEPARTTRVGAAGKSN